MSLYDPQRPNPDRRLVTRSPLKQSHIRRREWITVGMIFFALALVVLSIPPDSCSRPGEENLGDPGAIQTMPYPDLTALGDLPDAEEMELYAGLIDEYQERADRLYGQEEAVLLGWARERLAKDSQQPRIPMRVTPSDIARFSSDSQYRITTGSLVAVSGQIIERHATPITTADGSTESWYRLLIETAPQVYFQAWVSQQAGELPEGAYVNLVGRYLSMLPVPVAGEDDATVSLFTMAAFIGQEVGDQQHTGIATQLGIPGVEARIGEGVFRRDDRILTDIDDNGLRLERRPYYYLLGLVLRDRSTPGAYDEAQDALRKERALHHQAPEYRGEPFTVEGYVLRSWEDYDVARDQPFAVNRVIRMWLWNYVPRTRTVETTDGEQEIQGAGLGVYEVAAVVSDQRPLPGIGDEVRATGRFLKVQRYIRDKNFRLNRGSHGDQDRALSDSVYFKFIVASDYQWNPPREPIGALALQITVLVVFGSLLLFVVFMIDKDRKRMDDYKRPMRKLRKSRRAWHKQQRLDQHPAAAAPADASIATDDAEANGDTEADDKAGETAGEQKPDPEAEDPDQRL